METPPAGGPLAPGLLDAVAPHGAENFITNAFCWMLSNVPGLGVGFLDFLREKQCKSVSPPLGRRCIKACGGDSLAWETQTPFRRAGERPVRPDMTCLYGKNAVVFEHKTWSKPHCGQLADYRKFAPREFAGAPIVLITAHRGQRKPEPDLFLCWHEVHEFARTFVEQPRGLDPIHDYLIREFLDLLWQRGLGPMEKIEADATRSYFSVMEMKKRLKPLLTHVSQRFQSDDWCFTRPQGNLVVRKRWGRLGFGLWPAWDPGVFVGVLLDGWDHCTRPSHPESGPDACVILDLGKDLHAMAMAPYEPRYGELVDSLEKANLGEWKFYHHARDDNATGKYKGRNPWHPIHIRRPLVDVLGGAGTGEEQAARFYESTRCVVERLRHSVDTPWTRG